METFLIKGAQLIASLSFLIILHELGHFLPAKKFGVRVEKFFLFFDVNFAIWKKKIGETVYGIGWLPLGGYVKLSGMIDESMDTEALKEEPKPYEFRSKPAWQRLIIMLGGVTVNLFLGIVIYMATLFVWGEHYLPAKSAKYGVHVADVAQEIGFQEGDKLIMLNDTAIAGDYQYSDFTKDLLLESSLKTVTVENEGEKRTISVPEDFATTVLESGASKALFQERTPFIIDTVVAGKPAEAAGIIKDDQLISLAGTSTPYFLDFVKAASEHKGETVSVQLIRDADTLEMLVQISEEGKIGVGNKGPAYYFEIGHKEYTFLESIPGGVNKAFGVIGGYIQQFKLVFTKEGVSQLGGFGTLGSLFPSYWDWQSFWNMTAFLSLILAFMNVLPIPALDGGHVMFLTYEMITGNKPAQKVLEIAQMIGFFLLIGLVVYANANDIIREFFSN